VRLALEGLGALEGDPANLDRLFRAGFRMAAPSHFVDTDIGGSAAGAEKHGLTEKGRRVVSDMERLGMVIDLAHASEATIEDVLRVATRPVVVSHTGVRGTCDNPRNLSDAELRAIAARGGVVGIGFFATAVCDESPRAIARAIHHAVSVAGARHVALGSDWDGAVATPFDAAGLPELTAALREEGIDDEAIAAIMGGNALGLLAELLPE
jgi:microsomal dipeptidase-like Zn-dependent dipeptidase